MTDEDRGAGSDQGSWTVRVLGGALGAALTLGSLAWAADVYRRVGLEIYNEQFYAAMLAVGIALVFVIMPARRKTPRTHVPWYDALAALVGVGACVYVAINYEQIFENLTDKPLDGMIVSIIIIALCAEGLRRTAGKILFFFLVGFIVFGLLGHLVPGEFQGEEVALDDMLIYLGIDSNGLFGIAMRVSTTIVIAFVFFGNMLRPAGGGAFFTELSTALMGRYRGGSSKIAIVASSLFGSISGSAVSNVVSTGVITIPMMREGGYPAHSAAAIEAVASTGGQLMPPMMGAAAFVMAELLETQYKEVVLAALIPAILYYVALFIQSDLQAARDGIGRVDEADIPKRWPVVKAGWIFIVPFVVIILALFEWNLQPETAALYAAGTLLPIGLLLGYKGRRMRVEEIWTTLSRTGFNVVEILMIGAAAGMIMGVLNITGLGFGLSLALVKFAQGNLLVLLVLAALVCIVLGMGMPTLGVVPAGRAARRAVDHRARRADDVGPSVRPVLRHDVDDHATGGHRRVRRRQRGQGGRHEDRLRRGGFRMVGLCRPLPVRGGARADHAGRAVARRPDVRDSGGRRLAGFDRRRRLFHPTAGRGAARPVRDRGPRPPVPGRCLYVGGLDRLAGGRAGGAAVDARIDNRAETLRGRIGDRQWQI